MIAHRHEGFPRAVVRMLGRLAHRQHWGVADIGVLQQRIPFAARLRPEQLRQLRLQRGPLRPIVLGIEVRVVGQARQLAQLRVELRFDRSDGDVFPVRGLIGVVEMRPGIECVDAEFFLPDPGIPHPVDHAHQDGRPISHRRIDDLAFAAARDIQERADHPEGEHHPPSAEIADHVDRRCRLVACAPEMREGPGKGDVIDVVPGMGGIGPGLSPPGHAAVNELRIVGEKRVRAEAQTLHHAGAEPFDEAVRRRG